MINHKLMKKFMAHALKSLDGEWIIIGGTILPLMGIDHKDVGAADRSSDTILGTFNLRGIGSKNPVPDHENPTKVLV